MEPARRERVTCLHRQNRLPTHPVIVRDERRWGSESQVGPATEAVEAAKTDEPIRLSKNEKRCHSTAIFDVGPMGPAEPR